MKRHRSVDVAVITTIHPPFEPRIYARCYVALRDEGFKTAMISTWPKPEEETRCENWLSVMPSRSRLGRVLLAYRIWRGAARFRAKVYYFHDIDFLPWAVLLNVFTRSIVVYDCHENYPHEIRHNKEWIPRLFRQPLSIATRVIENLLVRRLGHVVVPVRAMISRFERLGANASLVRNVTDLPPNATLSHERAVLHSGSLTPSFGSDVLLEIARESRRRGSNTRFVLSTRNATPQTLSMYHRAISRDRLNIDLVEPVGSHDMPKLLAKGCIGLSIYRDTPEKRLAVPTKLFEYMAAGMPIVASDLPLIREVIKEAGAGILVPATDPVVFVDAIEQLMSDAQLFNAYREAGLGAASSIFNWKSERLALFAAVRLAMGEKRVRS